MAKFIKCEAKGLDMNVLRMKEIKQRIETVAEAFLNAVGTHAALRAKLNAPILTEDLRHQIHATLPVRESATRMSVSINSSMINPKTGKDYAYIQHEFQIPSDKPAHWLNPPRPLQHGERTARQKMTKEGGAGGKYIERVINANTKKYIEFWEILLRRIQFSGKFSSAADKLIKGLADKVLNPND